MPGPGGPMGGPRGGMMGPWGPTSSSYNRAIPPRYMMASRRYKGATSSQGELLSDRFFNAILDTHQVFKEKRKSVGTIKGTITAFRGLTSGGLRYEALQSKLKKAKKDFDEHRINELAYKKRVMNANKVYYSYLARIQYITEDEYYFAMKEAAEGIGVDYVYDAPEAPSRGGR